ncbi:MAG: hypothetical protein DRJ05_00950 [Bacteroidetes bacterium]|nr:MAG: hypothetical protein DRJ05_00950 [Bacteroidota bacterium]
MLDLFTSEILPNIVGVSLLFLPIDLPLLMPYIYSTKQHKYTGETILYKISKNPPQFIHIDGLTTHRKQRKEDLAKISCFE